MALVFTNDKVIKLKSFTREVWYDINLTKKTCSCPVFINGGDKRGICKHLVEVGGYKLEPYKHSAFPTFSQALSGLVKSLRIRNIEEAVYWLHYLLGTKFNEKNLRFRVARRLLIGTAEDGHSIPVMQECAKNFSNLCKMDTPLLYFVAEAVRICKIPNWWHPDSGGQDYIYQSMLGDRYWFYNRKTIGFQEIKDQVVKYLKEGPKHMAVGTLMYAGHCTDKPSHTEQANYVLDLAKSMGHKLAIDLCHIHLKHKGPLSGDTNFYNQAIWMLAGGVSPVAEKIEPVYEWECKELIEKTVEQWKTPHVIPSWCCDGLHCAGSDTRFAGMLPLMNAVSNAYNHYGRVDPKDKWLPEFMSFDGLEVKNV